MKTVIIMANSIKEAKQRAAKEYPNAKYIKLYRYASKGNNFYEFEEPTETKGNIKLYFHETSGGAKYLFDTFIVCPNGHQEGCINDQTRYVIRIDGDITKDAELTIR